MLILAGILAGILGWAATRLSMGQDVADLLPSLSEQDAGALEVLGRSTLFEKLYVELQGPDPGVLADYGGRLAERLERDPRIAAVESRVTTEQELKAASVVFEHRFHLLSPDAPGLAGRFSAEGVRRQLKLDRARLLGPVAGLAERVARDPLGLADIVRADMERSLAPARFRMYRGLAFTPDLERCLLALRTRVRSLLVNDAGRLVEDVRSAAEEMKGDAGRDVVVRVTGGHVLSSESARAIKSDVTRAFILAIAGIVALFLLYFRRPGSLLAGLLPSAAGVLAGFGTSSLVLGRVSGIAVGFGSIVVGISVDYSIHMLRERLGAGAGEAPFDSLRRIFPSLAAGFATTAVVFALYGLSSFPLIRELGLFAGSGVLAGFLCATIVLPLLPARTVPPRGRGIPLRRLLRPSRRASVIAVAAFALAAIIPGSFIPRLALEDDIRKLDYRDPETGRYAEEFERRWLGDSEGRVVIARGTTLQEALEANDSVARILEGAGIAFTSPAAVLPSARTQNENVKVFLSHVPDGARTMLEAEADVLGFAPGAFDPFFEDLEDVRNGRTSHLDIHDLVGTPMHHLVAGAVVRLGERVAVLSFLPGGEDVVLPPGLDAIATSRVEIMNRVFESVRSEVLRLIALSLLGILLVLLLRYRRLRPAALAMLPVVVACIITAGTFALADRPVNAIAVLAFTLILGVGLDYGIFMVDALERGPGSDHTAGAVLVSGLTTLVSFGVLTTCRSPVLESTGMVVLAGVLASLASALLLVPAIHVLAGSARKR